MATDREPSIAQLLEESKDMIRRFELLAGKDAGTELDAETQKRTLEDLQAGLEPAADAFFDLFVDEEGRTAVGEFRPPAPGGRPLDMDTIEAALIHKGVVHGVLWEVIRRAVEDCNLHLQLGSGVVIARATEAVPYVPQHFQLEDRWTEPPPRPEGWRVDFKEISPFVMVEAGALLAHRVPEGYGSHGTTVFGQEIPYPTADPVTWVPGEGVVETPVGLEAASDGRLILQAPHVAVSPVLELENGVDYRTGNVRFKGEVLIHGKVSSGFEVEADRDITATDTLDAHRLRAGGSIVTPAGIVGNGMGRVEAGGGVSAKFLEHLYLLAQGDVMVEASVLNSVVKTRGRLVLGEKGIVAGGQVHALHGAEVYQISTPTGPRTELFLGLDFQGMEKLQWIRERSQELHAQLKKVDAALPYGGARRPELMAAAKKLRLEIVQLTDAARNQVLALGQDEEASLRVRGTVYPGTTIEICHLQFVVNQKMSAVRFFLDKRKGIIGVETTTPSGASAKNR